MDNQQHQSLEKLYCYLNGQPLSNFEEISQHLSIPYIEVLPLIKELQFMGLDILIDEYKVQLLTPCDVIHTKHIAKHIEHHIKDLKNDKPIIYQFIAQSTNLLAKDNKQDSIYICDYQTQGKGRQAKKWLAPVGQSIAITIAHRFNFGLAGLAGLNIAIGVAIIETLKYFGSKNIGLKWPNDILGPRGKIAGILIEANGNTQSCRAIIGIGLNWSVRNDLFKIIEQPCSNAGIPEIQRTRFISQLIMNIDEIIEEFNLNGIQNIKHLWEQSDLFTNKRINIVHSKGIKSAVYKGINNNGLLNVEINGKQSNIASGEVSIRLL